MLHIHLQTPLVNMSSLDLATAQKLKEEARLNLEGYQQTLEGLYRHLIDLGKEYNAAGLIAGQQLQIYGTPTSTIGGVSSYSEDQAKIREREANTRADIKKFQDKVDEAQKQYSLANDAVTKATTQASSQSVDMRFVKALQAVWKSPQLTGTFGRIDILADLASLLSDITRYTERTYAATLKSYDVSSLFNDLNKLNKTSHGELIDTAFSKTFASKVVDPYLRGEQKDMEMLLTFWSRDEDARLRDALPAFMDTEKWQVEELGAATLSNRLANNQTRYLTSVIRRVSNMLATAYSDKASDMMKVQDLAVKSTLVIVGPAAEYFQEGDF